MPGFIFIAGGWLILYAVYLASAPGTFYFEDSAELLACSQLLGNTHGPGYSFLALTGKLTMLAPVGSPAFRFNLLSAACAAGAAAGLGALVAAVTSRFATKVSSGLAGIFASVVWGLSDTFWWQAVIGEKYAAFYLGFVILAWAGYVLAVSDRMLLDRRILAVFLVSGLALAHHMFSILLIPLAVIVLIGRAVSRSWPVGNSPVRVLLLGLLLAGLALSCKVVYPPIRSSARVALDWERTDSASGLFSYLTAARYFAPNEKRGEFAQGGVRQRILSAAKGITREFPLLLIAIAPLGAVKMFRAFPGLVWGLICAALLDFGFMLQFPERVSRWQEPAYAVILFFSAGGLAEMTASFARMGWRGLSAGAGIAIVLVSGIWQWERGIPRNYLSRFYAAHDMGRNILVSLPKGAIYLGRGDTDLFPLWAMIFGGNFRPDVAAAGLGSVVDVNPAGAGALEIVLGRAGLAGPCWASLYALSRRESEPGVYIAKTGYDPALWRRMGNLAIHHGHGLVGRLEPDWRFEESWAVTQRLLKRYSLRGLAYARSGAPFDPQCPRDEMALDGLMFYADSLVSFGIQSHHYGLEKTAIPAYRQAAKLLEPFTGRLGRPAFMPGLDRKGQVRMWAWILADGYDRLAARFGRCGAISRAETYRRTAEMCRI